MKCIYRTDVYIETTDPIPEFTDEFGNRLSRAISEIAYAGAKIMLDGLPAKLGRLTIQVLPLEEKQEDDQEKVTDPT